jgi:hypothetical protein
MNSIFYNTNQEYKKCAGKGCRNLGRVLLKINYINKKGMFCDTCSADLLDRGLAVKAGSDVI